VIFLDTHVWLWWVRDQSLLSPAAFEALDAGLPIAVSTVSCWEISLLVARGRVTLAESVEQWIERSVRMLALQVMPLSMEAAVLAGHHDFIPTHRDPADRMILASAVTSGARLVTRDERLQRAADDSMTIW
jgi:PIN domain nuclease of toxin-antitoxin system